MTIWSSKFSRPTTYNKTCIEKKKNNNNTEKGQISKHKYYYLHITIIIHTIMLHKTHYRHLGINTLL